MDENESVMWELTRKVECFSKIMFKDSRYENEDFACLADLLSKCLDTGDNILIYKASAMLVDISDHILISDKFNVDDKIRMIKKLNSLASDCARKAGKL